MVVPQPPSRLGAGWLLCKKCGIILYRKRWLRYLRTCPDCGHHSAMTAPERIQELLDPGTIEELEFDVDIFDPLQFNDTQAYHDRLSRARASTGLLEAVQGACGTIEGQPVVIACMDFRFLGGSLGSATGELVTQIGEIALKRRIPLIIVSASGGARMQEGALSLMQMAKTSAMLARLDAAGILTISLITDPTFGGVAASFATLCDIIIAEPGARMGFAGPRVIEQTIGQRLPKGFQTAEFLLQRGFVDFISPRYDLRQTLAGLLRSTAQCDVPMQICNGTVSAVMVRDPQQLQVRDASNIVREARRIGRLTTLDYAALVLDEFCELSGDRTSGDCPAIVGGIGRLNGRPVVLVGHQKGHDSSELVRRNFGMPSPSGYRKAVRIMRIAAKLAIPVITLIDTPGAHPGLDAEENGQAVAIAESIRLMVDLPVPVIAVVTGEGGSGGALALGVANHVLIWQNAVYSVISPEGCAAILWGDPAAADHAAHALKLQAHDLLEIGIVDSVLLEPPGGVDAAPLLAAGRLRDALSSCLADLSGLTGSQLRADRHVRFSRYGASLVTPLVSTGAPIEEAS
jgi:acyl-CoA carboxylase subunit beta